VIATVNQRVTHRKGGTTPPEGFFFAKEARKRLEGTRSERGWQTLQKLLKRAERKTVIARLRRKCDLRGKRSDP
jgi:NADH:ubiquinone oxidoreductase subunit F (NADH-binding)